MTPVSLDHELADLALPDPGLPGARSAETLARITDLFVRDAERFSDGHVAVFDEVIGLLADRIEVYARAALAERLADIPNAPPRVVRRLARDDISVARPILQRSARLDEADLVEVAMTFGQGHLLAISTRRQLPEAVTDVLIERGDRVVLHATVRNPGARISARGYGGLVTRARADEHLLGLLGERRDMPLERLHELLGFARAEARERLLRTVRGRSQDFVDAALEAGARTVGAEISGSAVAETGLAASEAAALHRAGLLTEARICDFAASGRRDEAAAGLAILAGLAPSLARRAFVEPQEDLLLILCRSVDFGWETAQALVALKAGLPARAPALARLEATYATLTRLTAQRVVRFLHAREAAGPPGPRQRN